MFLIATDRFLYTCSSFAAWMLPTFEFTPNILVSVVKTCHSVLTLALRCYGNGYHVYWVHTVFIILRKKLMQNSHSDRSWVSNDRNGTGCRWNRLREPTADDDDDDDDDDDVTLSHWYVDWQRHTRPTFDSLSARPTKRLPQTDYDYQWWRGTADFLSVDYTTISLLSSWRRFKLLAGIEQCLSTTTTMLSRSYVCVWAVVVRLEASLQWCLTLPWITDW